MRKFARRQVSSGSPLELQIGFCRAVRIGPLIAIAGTAPLASNGTTVCPGDVYGQTKRCLEIMRRAIRAAGGRTDQVIRTRIMLTDITRWRDAGRAHGEMFDAIRPACTFVQVVRFIDPAWLVETEADVCLEQHRPLRVGSIVRFKFSR